MLKQKQGNKKELSEAKDENDLMLQAMNRNYSLILNTKIFGTSNAKNISIIVPVKWMGI